MPNHWTVLQHWADDKNAGDVVGLNQIFSKKSSSCFAGNNINVELVDPSVVRTAWATLPAVLGRMAESQIKMTPECLVCRCIFRKPGSVTEDRIPTAFLWYPTLGCDRCALKPRSSWCGPANGSWIFGVGTSCGKSPGVVHRPRVLSMSHRRTREQVRHISYTRIFVEKPEVLIPSDLLQRRHDTSALWRVSLG